MTQMNDIKMVINHDRQERQPITAPTKNWRFSASYDSFVVQQTSDRIIPGELLLSRARFRFIQ
jgi:hypothetical protein